MIFDYVARLVAAQHGGSPEYWVGLDWRAGGDKWQTSYGEHAVGSTDAVWQV